MTIKELIKELQRVVDKNQDLEVWFVQEATRDDSGVILPIELLRLNITEERAELSTGNR